MRISMLIPCHNEEQSIAACLRSCLNQTRPFDEIIVVNDGSTDGTAEELKQFGGQIEVITVPKATGNKSYAQQLGLPHVTGDIFITTDADTIIEPQFVERILPHFCDARVAAVGGYVKSLKHNWLTACRELDYILGQDLHKVAQANLNFLFVIPGCAGAFRTDVFKKYIQFDHDTLTEDLDFTYKLHQERFAIRYERRAISYTQDPATLKAYTNQMRRWFAGGWQNLLKHYRIAKRPANALELSLMYVEGVVFSALMLLLPILSFSFFAYFIATYFLFTIGLGIYGSITRRRWDLLVYAPCYTLIVFVHAYIFLEQFVKEIILRKRNLVWFQPERRRIV